MKAHKWLLTAALLATGAWSLVSCTGGSDVKIGVIIPVEGNLEEYGYQIRSGIQMAFEEVQERMNAANSENKLKRNYTLIMENESSDLEVVKETFKKLQEQGVNAVIGAASSEATMALAPLANEAEIILLSPASSSPEINEGQTDFVFRNQPSDTLEAQQLANVIFQKCKMQKVLMVRARTAYGEGITFEMLRNARANSSQIPNKVVKFDEDPSQVDFVAVVDEIVAVDPEAIFMAAYTNELVPLLQELRARPELEDLYIFTSSAFLPDQVIKALGPEAVEGVIFTDYPWDPNDSRPEIQAFSREFLEKFNTEPGIFAAHGYEALHILVQAFENVQHLLPDELRGEMNNLKYQGLLGELEFNKRGDVTRIPVVYRMEDGRRVELSAEEIEKIKRDILTRI